MAESKKVQAFALYDLGLRPSADEVKAIIPVSKTRYNYFQVWKKIHPEANDGSPSSSEAATPLQAKSGTLGAPMVVGKITITPENWGMDQKGAILIIDTYTKAKRDIGYTGTIGDFIVDICVFFRRVQCYEEVFYARAEGREGERGAEENGGQGNGATTPE